MSVGSRSNNDVGEDCRRAAILEFNPDGTGYRVYASGIRNPVGLALQPGTDTIWTAMNERDNLGDDLVPDYATSVKDGAYYGWPWYYIGANEDPRHKGARPDLAGSVTVPDVLMQAHSAPLNIAFYDGGNVFRTVGFHGQYLNNLGIGLRYATPVGPVRIDIGHNLNGQPGIKSTQIFITLGQAF